MPRAIWNGTVIAASDEIRSADGYTYFPKASVAWDLLSPSEHTSRCGWKGTATYWHVVVGANRNANAAWSYLHTSDAARHLEGWVGFWKGVRVEP